MNTTLVVMHIHHTVDPHRHTEADDEEMRGDDEEMRGSLCLALYKKNMQKCIPLVTRERFMPRVVNT